MSGFLMAMLPGVVLMGLVVALLVYLYRQVRDGHITPDNLLNQDDEDEGGPDERPSR